MGSYLTNLWWGGDPDIPEPISGLSKRDIYTVQRTWANVNANAGEYGMELFLRLFRKDTNTQKFFKVISGLLEDQIREKVMFKAHVLNLMSSLNNAVVNLNTPEVVVALMNKLGTSHRSRHIEIHHFEVFKTILVEFFIHDLKSNEATVGSLDRFFTFILRHIYENLKE